MIRLAFAAAAMLAVSPIGAQAQEPAYRWTEAGTLTPTPPAPAFVMFAGAGDLYEIESSRLVLETTQNPALRTFAQMLIDHHTRLSADTAAAAERAGVSPAPPMLDGPKAAMIAALGQYGGVERDRLYLVQQQMAHKEALGLHKTYADTGDTPALRTAAQAAVPVVTRHLAEIERLMR